MGFDNGGGSVRFGPYTRAVTFSEVDLLSALQSNPIVVSVQASDGSGLDDPSTLLKLARCSLNNGAAVLRLQGVSAIEAVSRATGAPIIGLIKREYPGSSVYITPTQLEVAQLLGTSSQVIALDATLRDRPNGATFQELSKQIHEAGRWVLADCDNESSVRFALQHGADLISTTLAGYTDDSRAMPGPDLEFLRQAVSISSRPVLAEGRFVEAWQVQAAMRIGAVAVVMGGAVNDPVKQTRMFASSAKPVTGCVAAFDIGGTWLRAARFDAMANLLESDKTPLPPTRHERLAWMRNTASRFDPVRIGVSSGGTIDPASGRVIESKPLIPENEGTVYDGESLGFPTLALNDGLATAWGHACHPSFAGRSVATLAVGTGVGCGWVRRHQLHRGERGEYPRLNDLPTMGTATIEELLGGAGIASGADPDHTLRAAQEAIRLIQTMWLPDDIVICGAVGLSLAPALRDSRIKPSPYGEDAGLFGAAALALFPPSFG